ILLRAQDLPCTGNKSKHFFLIYYSFRVILSHPKKAAEKGFPPAQFSLGLIYFKGIGVKKT
ncbi:MAG: hypothetical protein RR808_09020, partial [Akkermansia sp.]